MSNNDKISITKGLASSLAQRLDRHNAEHAKHPDRQVRIETLNTVAKRAIERIGASNEERASKYALARVHAFLYMVTNGAPLDPKYTQDNDLIPSGQQVKALGPTISERNGTTGPQRQGPKDKFRRDVRDADGDGVVQEGTDWERIESKSAKRNPQSAPAKISERIRGSERNSARSAASNSAAADISLTPQLVAALRRKVDEHNDAMRRRNAPAYRMASLPMLKAVLRRGMGAFSVSHRPNVSSRQQWGMARVNAFLRLLRTGRPSDAKYISDNDLLPSGHERASRTKSLNIGDRVLNQISTKAGFRAAMGSIRNAPYKPNARAVTRRRRLISEPFDADARDGDGDQIVQEGTIWERPAGTHWVTAEGKRIEDVVFPRGGGRKKGDPVPAHLYHPSMRLVDKDGKNVEYIPTWAGEGIGVRTGRRLGSTIGGRIAAPQKEGSTEQRDVSTPHRLARFSQAARNSLLKMFRTALPPIERDEEKVDPDTGETTMVKKVIKRPGSRYTPDQAKKRMRWLLAHVRSSFAREDDQGDLRSIWRAGQHWYEQQHFAMRRIAERRNVDFRVAVAVLAATSPRNPWDQWAKDRRAIQALADRDGISFQEAAKKFETELFSTPNIDVADFLLGNWEAMRDEDVELTDGMIEGIRSSLSRYTNQLADFEQSLKDNPSRTRKLGRLLGSNGNTPTDLEYKLAGVLMAGRAFEAQDHNVTYLSAMVANALQIIDGGPDKIDDLLSGPKARSFYDNIAFFNQSDAVTIDSIMTQLLTGLDAEAAGELLKRSGVKLSEGATAARSAAGKNVGPYGVYAVLSEILHQVTEEWNADHPTDLLSVTDVQAILWYIQRERLDIIDLLNKEQL